MPVLAFNTKLLPEQKLADEPEGVVVATGIVTWVPAEVVEQPSKLTATE